MIDKYEPQKIEKKWQKYWANHPKLYAAADGSSKEKKYILDMFPYPSGEGLHVGHVESYTATDIISRYWRMQGKNVLHPQGWDAFGLPAENYAVKNKIHPAITTQKAIKNFKKQMISLGLSYDWSREINSSCPEYYKWTQWFFLLLYKNGYAYRAKAKVNFCPKCQTVLANEQVISGKCERCETNVVQKDLKQWFFKITDFIEDIQGETSRKMTSGLISGLDKVDWPESTKAAQKNWIGKSEGAIIKFKLTTNNQQLTTNYIEVFTTRLDTIYGCTYCVVAPEHKLISNLKSQISNFKEVEKYLIQAQNKTELERMEEKDKTGVEIKGFKAINPFTNEEVPIFVADYVLGHYGTGAVMAVPAHDERDWEFAKKYNLPIKQSVTPNYEAYQKTVKTLDILKEIQEKAEKEDIKIWLMGGLAIPFYAQIIYREHSDIDLIVKNSEDFEKSLVLLKNLGFKKIEKEKASAAFKNLVYEKNNIKVEIGANQEGYNLTDNDFEIGIKILDKYKTRILSVKFIKNFKKFQLKNRKEKKDEIDWEYLNGKIFVNDGFLVNSGKYSGLTSQQARAEMVKWLEENNLGKKKINYKLRDWLVSRQRYWGAPIPIIYCDKCGVVPVPEKDLPVELPDDVDFLPTGESPLARSKKFHSVQCPLCGAKARRESDTMDTFVCSSWYYFRYADPQNKKKFASGELIKKWLPIDLYVGGAEHTVLHLLYSRFFTKILHRLGYIDFDEPFQKLRHQGIILGEDNQKMSKSRGNVINPDDVIKEYGADALRCFEMFMGPLEDMKPWQTKGIIGIKRFLERVWRLQSKCVRKNSAENKTIKQNIKLEGLLHKTIKKITEDIESLRFNTAISQLMILTNEMEKEKELIIENYQTLIILLSPFAPHISEELWERLGYQQSVFLQRWPEYNSTLIKDKEIDFIFQVNGKVRDCFKINADLSEAETLELAQKSQKLKKYLVGKEPKKVIFIKNKLINIVI